MEGLSLPHQRLRQEKQACLNKLLTSDDLEIINQRCFYTFTGFSFALMYVTRVPDDTLITIIQKYKSHINMQLNGGVYIYLDIPLKRDIRKILPFIFELDPDGMIAREKIQDSDLISLLKEGHRGIIHKRQDKIDILVETIENHLKQTETLFGLLFEKLEINK